MALSKETISELQLKKKTKFPLTRIKKIMQQNEDVGKASVTVPVVISKALELLFFELIGKMKKNAEARKSFKIVAEDLKDVITSNPEEYGFLSKIFQTEKEIE
jgi:hypothetical protein